MPASLPCDCHVHVFDPERFPYVATRKFTPATADVNQLTRHLRQTFMRRVVLVQPSVYGTDNRCMVDALAQLDGCAKGVAVISKDASKAKLDGLTAAGVVGARLNMAVTRSEDAAEACRVIEELDDMLPDSWHVQLHVSLGVLAAVSQAIGRSNRLFVLDHLGLPSVLGGTKAEPWQKLLSLTRSGQLCVKLSGPYLSSKRDSPYLDLRPFVDSLAQENPDVILWGSNWPHTQGIKRSESGNPLQIEEFRKEEHLAWPEACANWLGSALFERMHSNASRVYGFNR